MYLKNWKKPRKNLPFAIKLKCYKKMV